jgi:hypothetical protein
VPAEDERRAIADDLWRYGDDDHAQHAFNLTDHELERMGEFAGEHSVITDVPSGAGMLFSTAIALAAVEVIEGNPRPLARTRRRPLDQRPYRI